MKRLLIQAIMAAVFLITPLKADVPRSSTPRFQDLTILVPSCDRYSELWEPFFSILFDQWKSLKGLNEDLPILLISNHLDYWDQRVETLRLGKELSWSQNMIEALKKVKTSFVLIILEDYFLTKVDEPLLYDAIEKVMKQEGAGYIQVACGDDRFTPKTHARSDIKGLYLKPQNAKYRPSLQACLFNKEVLLKLLNPTENPWQFEVVGSKRSEQFTEKFYSFLENPPLEYVNACYQGHVMGPAFEYVKKYGLTLDPKKLKKQEDDFWYFFWEGKIKNPLRNVRDAVYKTLGINQLPQPTFD
ncbi:MAG TPA: hypothetical protein VI959_04265 [Alphaproteobacteria bacterium]|nr:hypothetical protein [Alphaproteobacteria bacterium]